MGYITTLNLFATRGGLRIATVVVVVVIAADYVEREFVCSSSSIDSPPLSQLNSIYNAAEVSLSLYLSILGVRCNAMQMRPQFKSQR